MLGSVHMTAPQNRADGIKGKAHGWRQHVRAIISRTAQRVVSGLTCAISARFFIMMRAAGARQGGN